MEWHEERGPALLSFWIREYFGTARCRHCQVRRQARGYAQSASQHSKSRGTVKSNHERRSQTHGQWKGQLVENPTRQGQDCQNARYWNSRPWTKTESAPRETTQISTNRSKMWNLGDGFEAKLSTIWSSMSTLSNHGGGRSSSMSSLFGGGSTTSSSLRALTSFWSGGNDDNFHESDG